MIETNKIKNMTYIFAIPANITDLHYENLPNNNNNNYINDYIITTAVNETE